MKRFFTFLAVSAITLSLVSCNKKLKDDMRDLENSVNEQKTNNNNLQNQLDNLTDGIAKTPLKVNFSTTDNADAAVSYSGDFGLVSGSDYTNSYIEDNGDGTYDVYVRRLKDLGTDYLAVVQFTYNPSTSAVTSISAQTQGYGSKGENINVNFTGITEITQTVSVGKFDFNEGKIEFNYSANTTAAYSGNEYLGKTMAFTATYAGSMAKYY